MAAYYCFVNLGWPPSKYDDLPYREKVLVTNFCMKSMRDREDAQKKAEQNKGVI